METDCKRAVRRHHRARLKAKRASYYGGHARGYARLLNIYANTIPTCSCWMCGNPRRHFGEKTLAEKRFDEFWRIREPGDE